VEGIAPRGSSPRPFARDQILGRDIGRGGLPCPWSKATGEGRSGPAFLRGGRTGTRLRESDWNDSRQGWVPVQGFRIFYRIFEPRGERRGTILCLHGGPGATHDYILPLADLRYDGFRVVFFDALGCGLSERPPGTGWYLLSEDVQRAEGVRRALDLGRVHLMGSSYGGLLALACALEFPRSWDRLVVSGGLANVPLAVREMARLKAELPGEVRDVLRRYEAQGDYRHPAYLAAVQEFYRRHVCRLDPWPAELVRSFEHISEPVYLTMNGPNEFTIQGNIREVDLTSRLSRIRHPCLLTVGEYDEVTPVVAEDMRAHLPNAKLVVFPGASHVHMWEARDTYIQTVADFLLSKLPEGRGNPE